VSFLIALLVVVAVTPAVAMADDTAADHELVSWIAFDLDLDTFSRSRSRLRREHPHLDWTTDGCSAPVVGSVGRSFDFRQACIRHDFGYRNFKRLGLFDAQSRLALDRRFREDMDESCATRRRTRRVRCVAWAEIYYAAVRATSGP
jgi:hypothetical protein